MDLNDVLRALVRDPRWAAGSLSDALQGLAEVAARALSVQRVGVWCVEGSGITCLDQFHEGRGHSHGAFLPIAGAPGYFDALREERVVDIPDAPGDPRMADLVDTYLVPFGVGALLDAPVLMDGALAGVVCLEHLGGSRAWTAEERAFAASLADLVALAMQAGRRREAERVVREQEAQLALAMQAAGAGAWFWDVQRDVVHWSDRVAELFGQPAGWQPPDVDSYLGLVHPDDRAAVRGAIGSVLERGGDYHVLHRNVLPGGGLLWLEARGRLLTDDQGAPMRLVGIASDVTARRELEERVAGGERLESLGRLAGGVAHDFNNLLTAIGGAAGLLEESVDADDVPLVHAILESTERAADLTRQLLVFGRRQPTASGSVDLALVTQNTCGLLGRLLGEQVTLRVRADGPAWVRGEPSQVQRLLTNLAVNARDAMPDGGTLDFEVDVAGEEVVLRVVDTGVGIPAEALPRIFEPFFTTKADGLGTGLGLAVCHGVVEQLGGRIEVESEAGSGTTFTARLPRGPQPAPERDGAVGRAGPVGRGRVLVVEDDDAVAGLLVRILRRGGYTVERASTGREAVEQLALGAPDALLCDVVLPELSGVEVVRRARALYPTLPMMLMTGYAPDGLDADVRSVPLLSKPFLPADLLDLVARTLQES